MFWPDVSKLRQFYQSPLGKVTQRLLLRQVRACWPEEYSKSVQQILGVGFAHPYLKLFNNNGHKVKHRVISLMPASEGVIHWPDARTGKPNKSFLSDELCMPLQDGAMDKILLAHALEFTDANALLSEAWRVLAPGGTLLCIVPSRRGLWSRAEHTPFGHGQPFTSFQLHNLLEENDFTPLSTEFGLFIPPSSSRLLLKIALGWEKLGKWLSPMLGSVLIVHAEKRVFAPVRGTKAKKELGIEPALARNGISNRKRL